MREGDAYIVMRRSHAVVSKLLTQPSPDVDELIFLEFRPAYLKAQRRVYDMLGLHDCHICMYTTIPELVAKQHSDKHPTICVRCYERLKACPFCRTPFQAVMTYSEPVPPIDRFVEFTPTYALSIERQRDLRLRPIGLASPTVFRRFAEELGFSRSRPVARVLSEQFENEASTEHTTENVVPDNVRNYLFLHH